MGFGGWIKKTAKKAVKTVKKIPGYKEAAFLTDDLIKRGVANPVIQQAQAVAKSKPGQEVIDEVSGKAMQRKMEAAYDKQRASQAKYMEDMDEKLNRPGPARAVGIGARTRKRRATLITGAQGLGTPAITRKPLLGM